MLEPIQVVTTAPTRELALQIAAELVEQRLAACVQVGGPITSTYRWQGKIETAEEWVCIAKCQQQSLADIETAIARLHPYDTPEIIALPISGGSQKYLQWIGDETGPVA